MTAEELKIVVSASTEKVQEKIGKLKTTIASMVPQKTPDVNVNTNKAHGNLKKLQAEIDRTQAKINKLVEKQNALQMQIESRAEMYSAVPNLSGMGHEETVGTLMDNDPKIQKLTEKMNALDAQIAPLNAHIDETKAKIAQLGNVAEPVSQRVNKLGKQARQSGISFRFAGNHAGYFGRMVKSMLVGMILYRGIAFITQSISEGMQNIAQGSNVANGTLSRLATSFLYVRNSIASAFLPAIQAIEPALVSVMNKIADFMNWIGMLTARIFGNATTFTRAKSAAVNYAQSLGGVAKQAKNAKGSLASFDQINTLQKNDNSSASVGKPGMPAAGNMFEQVQIPQDVLSLADRIRSIGQAIQPVLPLLGLFALGILAIVSPGLALKLMIVGLIAIIVYLVVNWNNLTMSQKVVLIVIAALIAAIIVLTTVQLAFNAAMLASPITWIILGIVALIAIIVLLATNWDKVKAAGANAWAWIKNAWNTAANWFNGNVIQPVAGFFGWLWDSIKYGAAQAWQGLKDGFRAVMNFIIDGINLFISTALAPFNLIISGLNKIPNVNIPYLAFSIPHIPRLATGGVIKGATPIIAGEDGAEAIVPLERNTGWIAQIAAQLKQQGGMEGAGDINITIPVYLDSGTLIDTIVRKINRLERAGG